MALTMNIELPRRRADVFVSKYWADYHNIDSGKQPCHVLGLFQEVEDSGRAYPAFVCELDSGQVIKVPVRAVKFVDTDEKGAIL